MAKVKIPYYVVKNGNGFWQPSQRMRQLGFLARTCGPDGPAAWKRAWGYYQDWQDCRSGRAEPTKYIYPRGSFGEAWERYRRTNEWAEKAAATRAEWDYVWGHIEPVFGDVSPTSVTLEHVSALRTAMRNKISAHAAHKVIKVWRAFWKVMAAMQYCIGDRDPSLGLRNRTPKKRHETWSEGEVAQLVKAAWREGYRGLAAIIAIVWDTQFSPGDVRTLTSSQRRRDAKGEYFDQSRGKTGKAVLGTLSARSSGIMDAYLADLPFEVHDDAPLFRNRSAVSYTKDKLGDDFRTIRELVFPGDKRRLMDMRRSGSVEALAGEASVEDMAAKMGNSIDKCKELQEVYLPKRTIPIRRVDEARIIGRKRLRENK